MVGHPTDVERRRRARGRLLALSLMAGAALVAACSGDDGGGAAAGPGDDPSTPSESTTGDAGEPDGRFSELLRYVPVATEGETMVLFGDADAASDAHALPRPSVEDTDTEIAGWFADTQRLGDDAFAPLWSFAQATDAADQDASFRAELGWSLTQIDRYVEATTDDGRVFVVEGSFDPDAVREVLAGVPFWSHLQEEVEYGDSTYYLWGDTETFHREATSPARPLGRAGPMSVATDRVIQTTTVEMMESALDGEDEDGGLYAEESFRLAAEVFDDEPVIGAFMTDFVLDGTDPVEVMGPSADQDDLAAYDPGPLLEDVDVVANGYGYVDGELHSVLVIVAGSERAAEANERRFADRLEVVTSTINGASFGERIVIDRSEVRGRATVFWLEEGYPGFLRDQIFKRENLFVDDGT